MAPTWHLCSQSGWLQRWGIVFLFSWILAPENQNKQRSSPVEIQQLLQGPFLWSSVLGVFWKPAGKERKITSSNNGTKKKQTTKYVLYCLQYRQIWEYFYTNIKKSPTTASPFFIPKHVSIPSWSAIATWNKRTEST